MKIHVDGWSWLKLGELDEVSITAIKRKLTLVDVVKRSAVTNRIYLERDGLIGIPRSFFRKSVTKDHEISYSCSTGAPWPDRVDAPDGVPWAAAQDGGKDELVLVDAFTGEKSSDFFSKDQKTGINMIMNSLSEDRSGDGIAIFSSEQAAAKVCLFLIRTFKMRTLVLTPPGAPLAMWRTVAGRYLPDAKIGVIRRGERDVLDAHVTISTVDDIYDFTSQKLVDADEFGFVITHGIHRIDPIAWTRAASFFRAAKRLGLADPGVKFDSGLQKVYKYHLGDPVFCSDPDLETPKIRRVWSEWKVSIWAKVNPQFISKDTLLGQMCTNTTYNQHVVEQIVLAMKADRKIVVLSDKLQHLTVLKQLVEAEWAGNPKVIDLAVDGMPPDDLAKAIEANVILTTYSFVKSMPEVVDLDTVVLATPVRDPLPAARLCQIKHPTKKPVVVVDMRCDDIPICKEYAKVRDAAYRSSFGADSA